MPEQSDAIRAVARPVAVFGGPPRVLADPWALFGASDLDWIVAEFQRQCGADAALLSQHYAEDLPAKALHMTGDLARGNDEIARIAAAAEKCGTFGRRRADDPASRMWKRVRIASRDLDLLSLSVTSHHHRRLVMTALYDSSGAGLDRDQVEASLDALHPPLSGYFRLWLASRAQLRRSDALASALNGSRLATFVLDRAGDLIHTNAAADALLDAGNGLRRNGSSVTAIDLNDALRLQLTVEHVVTGTAQPSGGRLPVVHLRRAGKARPLIVGVMPVEVPPATRTDPATVLYAIHPDLDLDRLLRPACEHYGLSPVETRLVVLLTQGATLADTARQLRVKELTARAYLKQIFIKTDTNRQAELVGMMMASLMPALAPGE